MLDLLRLIYQNTFAHVHSGREEIGCKHSHPHKAEWCAVNWTDFPARYLEVPVYRLSGKRILFGISNVVAILVATGCQPPPQAMDTFQSAPQPIAEIAAMQQLIIKFKHNTIACDAAGIAQLSSATRVPVIYVRPMSGNACVVRQSADDASSLEQGQETLRQHPAVEWLERDAKMKAL